MSARRTPAVLQSFNWAFEGVIHVLRTERNMRIHFALATAVLILAFSYGVTKLELMALLIAISFVLIAEMVNTAVEATIDLATTSFDPLAKMAKDIAAGAVLSAIGCLAMLGILIVLIVIASKALTGSGTPLRGGLPSGHAALAFGGWVAITFIVEEERVVVSFVALIMALLVAQTRVESGIHTTSEVVLGAVTGTLVSMILFQVLA